MWSTCVPKPTVLIKKKAVLHFYQGVKLNYLIYTPVIKMQYYKLLLVRRLNSVCFLLLVKSSTFLFILSTMAALNCLQILVSTSFIVFCLHPQHPPKQILNFFNVLAFTSGCAHCAACSLFPKRAPALLGGKIKCRGPSLFPVRE